MYLLSQSKYFKFNVRSEAILCVFRISLWKKIADYESEKKYLIDGWVYLVAKWALPPCHGSLYLSWISRANAFSVSQFELVLSQQP